MDQQSPISGQVSSVQPPLSQPVSTSVVTPQAVSQQTVVVKQGRSSFLVILLLIFLNPVGLIVMWAKSSWSTATKIVVTVLSFIFIIIPLVLVLVMIAAINPIGMMRNTQDAQNRSREIQQRTQQEIYNLK